MIGPEEARANVPLTPPSGIAAGMPTTDSAEAKLAVDKAVEMMLEPAANQFVVFLACLYFFATLR